MVGRRGGGIDLLASVVSRSHDRRRKTRINGARHGRANPEADSAIPSAGPGSHLPFMTIRLMKLIHTRKGRSVEVITLAERAFSDPENAEVFVYSGGGGIATLPLLNGTEKHVWRDQVEAICGWEEG